MGKLLPHTLSFDPLYDEIKKAGMKPTFFYFLVELRGIEPLTPRLPEGKDRKTQSLSYRLVSRFCQ
jgi:hypothetical protein